MANNFRWFDQPAREQFPSNMAMSPSNMESYVSGGINSQFVPRQQGFLTLLGKTMSGIAAPFAGDYQWASRENEAMLRQQQADQEFYAALQKQRLQSQQFAAESDLRKAQINYMNSLATIGNQSGLSAQLGGQPVEQTNLQPTLADAIKVREKPFLERRSISSTGSPYVNQVINPAYQKELELRNFTVKDVSAISEPLERAGTVLDSLREAVKATPDFKEGGFSKLKAQATLGVADLFNTPWYKNYEQAYNQSFLPIAQSLGSSKVLSDRDIETIQKALGDMTVPKEIKLKAIDNIEKQIGSGAKSKLKSFNVDENIWGSIYPTAYKRFVGESKKEQKTLTKDNLFEGL